MPIRHTSLEKEFGDLTVQISNKKYVKDRSLLVLAWIAKKIKESDGAPDNSLPAPAPGTPDNSLPETSPGVPDQGLPPTSPGTPDQGLPGRPGLPNPNPPAPGQGLPGFGGLPQPTPPAPGQGLPPDRIPPVDPNWGVDVAGRPDQGLPPAPDQGLPGTPPAVGQPLPIPPQGPGEYPQYPDNVLPPVVDDGREHGNRPAQLPAGSGRPARPSQLPAFADALADHAEEIVAAIIKGTACDDKQPK